MSEVNFLALVGSLRTASVNRQIAELAAAKAPDGVSVAIYDGLGDTRSTTRISMARMRRRRR